MRRVAFGLLCTAGLALAQEKHLLLHHTTADILVDGIMEAAWIVADSTADFFQMEPYYGQAPKKRTIARVLSSDESLYCLIVCYDDPENIQRTAGVHDQGSGDVVSIMLDTFNDRRTAYRLQVSAAGVRGDARLLDDGRNRDYSWDGVWFSAARITPWGYVVEMMIPYKSLRYDPAQESWGLDFDRWVPERHEDLYWNRYEQNEGLRVSRFGRLLLNGVRPRVTGVNLEVYPVGIARATYLRDGKYRVEPRAGIDVFFNPSEALTFQLTGNPDFAQIEADPFEFNISRYETYYNERRPFFTEGNEIFMPAGRETNTGFYRPLELFYSRRIGRLLPDGTTVPLQIGTKAFGRVPGWEYGGFYALTGGQGYREEGDDRTEPRSHFASVRLRKQILDNSSVGVLFVGKQSQDRTSGVLDVDGAFRGSTGQMSWQLARSFRGSEGDFAASAGFVSFGKTWAYLTRTRLIGKNFDVSDVGYVPWMGTSELTAITGPVWYFDDGPIKNIFAYGGGQLLYKDAELYVDRSAAFGFNMQLRSGWGYEITVIGGRSRDQGKTYTSTEIDLSSWYNISPAWEGNLWGGYARTYNFSRDYLAPYAWMGARVEWKVAPVLTLGTSVNGYLEGNPAGGIEDVTVNARPFFSLTPVNDLNVRVYVDNLYARSSDKMERVILGLLFGYNFSPKSWIYLAFNELRDRSEEINAAGTLLSARLHTIDRVAVAKVKYLYYF